MYACSATTEYVVDKENTETSTIPEEVPTLCEKMLLYKGESENIEIANVGGSSSVSFISEDTEVATVSQNVKIKAKSCGRTEIIAEMKTQKMDESGEIKNVIYSKMKIILTVKISKLHQTKVYGKKIVRKKDNEKMPVVQFHKTLLKGRKSTVSLSGLADNAKVTYKSTAPSIVKVDRKGKIKACKKGEAVIIISVTQNGCKYTFKEKIHVSTNKEKATITKKQRDAYFSKSAFLGNSLAVGQKIYFDSQGKDFLGNPTMIVKTCYSFYYDKSNSSNFRVDYKGEPCQAKDAIYRYKVKRVFINMGMNDLWKSPELTYKDYVAYIKGIRKKNPNVVIFIESTTPVCNERGESYLNNVNVNKLNAMMAAYCKKQKNMYYIDVSSGLKGADGHLKKEYCSDGYVHLNLKGYEVWTNAVCKYVDNLLIKEQEAKDAVETAIESRMASDYKEAKKKLAGLEKSTVKEKLEKRLKKAKNK